MVAFEDHLKGTIFRIGDDDVSIEVENASGKDGVDEIAQPGLVIGASSASGKALDAGGDLADRRAREEEPLRILVLEPCPHSRGRAWTSRVGKRTEPVTAMATMTVSRMTVPMIQPTTARVASFSDLAEKNF